MAVLTDDDIDNISVTSTVESEARDDYPVDCILAEDDFPETDDDGKQVMVKRFLVKWEGYDVLRSTWEPESNFNDKTTLFKWQDQQMQVTRGHIKPFDLNAWYRDLEKQEDAKIARRLRRRQKRLRCGLSVSEEEPATPESAHVEDSTTPAPQDNDEPSDSEGDAPLSQVRRAKRKKSADSYIRHSPLFEEETDSDGHLNKKRQKVQPVQPAVGRRENQSLGANVTARRVSNMNASSFFSNQKPLSRSIAVTQPVMASRNMGASASTGAGMAGMGPARVIRPPLLGQTLPPRSNALGAGVFANWDKPVVRKTSKTESKAAVSNPAKIRNLQHLNRYQKKARNEPAPSLDSIQLQALTTEINATPVAPVRKESGGNDFTTRIPLGAETSGMHTLGEAPLPKDKPSTTPASLSHAQHADSPSFLDSPTNLSNKDSPREWPQQLVCWFHTHGGCTRGSACGFAHQDTGSVAPPYNVLDSQDATCFFWITSRCFKPESKCRYLHRRTAYVATLTGELIDYDTYLRQNHIADPAEFCGRDGEADPELVTCLYWAKGGCLKSEAECKYAHRPGAFVACRGGPNIPYEDFMNELARSQPAAAAAERKTSAFTSDAESRPSINATLTTLQRKATCFDWLKASCSKLEKNCSGAHRVTNRIRLPSQEIIPLAEYQGSVTCRLWYAGHCPHSYGGDCSFVHKRTRLISGSNGGTPEAYPGDIYDEDVNQGNPVTSHSITTPGYSRHRTSDSPSPPPRSPREIEISSDVLTLPNRHLIIARPSHPEVGASDDSHSVDSMKAIIAITIEGQAFSELPVGLLSQDTQQQQRLNIIVDGSKLVRIQVDSVLLVQHVTEHFRFDDNDIAGDIQPAKDQSSLDLNIVADTLKLHSSVAIGFLPHFIVIFFPPAGEEWRHLRSRSGHRADAKLHFYIFVNPELVASLNKPSQRLSAQEIVSSQRTGPVITMSRFDLERLLTGPNGKPITKNVFIVFHPRHEDAANQLTKQLHTHGAKVWHSTRPGAWRAFLRRPDGGALIFLFDFLPFHQLYKLGAKLDQCNCFQLVLRPSNPQRANAQVSTGSTDGSSIGNIALVRLFPAGKVVLMTDDCFERYPSDAMRIVHHMIKQSNDAGRTRYKIVGRPGLDVWLQGLVSKDQLAGSAMSRFDKTLLDLSHLVQGQVAMDHEHAKSPTLGSLFYWFPLGVDETLSTDYMVSLFANWAVAYATQYRRFSVVTMADERTLDRWGERYMHLEFLNPTRWLEWEERNEQRKRRHDEKKVAGVPLQSPAA